jgi:hypothetical protein
VAGEDDLVSKVKVEGTEESGAKLDKYASEGAAAFDKLDRAAKKSAGDIAKSAGTIETSLAGAATSVKAFANTRIGGALVGDFDRVQAGAKNFVTAIRSGIPAIASFVARLTGAGAAAAAAGVGILKLASNVVKASSATTSAADKQAEAQTASNDAALEGQIAAINLASSQKVLFGQFQRGEISFTQYSESLKTLNRDFDEQRRVAAEVAFAQETVRLENEKLKKSAEDNKAFQAQADIFGGPLLSSLIQLGNQANALFKEFQQAFGPAIATGIDLISKTLTTNGTAISTFFSTASAKVTKFLSENGPAISKAFETIGSAVSTVFEGLLAAMPGLLDFFNNSLVPAFKGFGAILDTIATAINAVFGTKFTGGAIVVLVILGQMTGAFVALINVIRLVGAAMLFISGLPFGAVLLAIAATIGVLLFLFPSLRQTALDAFNAIVAFIKGIPAFAANAAALIVAAWGAVVNFFSTLFTAIGGFFKAGWDLIVAGVKIVVESIMAAWNGVVEFFKKIVNSIVQFFTDMWNSIVDAFNNAIETIKGVFASLFATAKAKLQPIIDMLKSIIGLAGDANSAGGGGASVTAAGGGHIRGPGTSRSDSIPAWLSNNEFVIQAKRVRQYGLGFLHAVNQGRFKMPKFNMGGLVSRMIAPSPRFAYADGGEVSGSSATLRPINVSIMGENFPMFAPEEVGDRLTKFAVARQTRSAGRKPSWLGRGRN